MRAKHQLRVFSEKALRDFVPFVQFKNVNNRHGGVLLSVLQKKVFRKILQNSQKSTCFGVSFLINLQALGLQLY